MQRVLVDAKFCMGCHACEVACKQEHDLPAGPRLIRVELATEKASPTESMAQYKLNKCRHCTKAPCIVACPTGALTYGEMGMVSVRQEDCIGCRECSTACPFGVPQFSPEDGTVLLCDMCISRVKAGKLPSCVQHCPAGALILGDVNHGGSRY